jgi:hydroxypyruvate isomerase
MDKVDGLGMQFDLYHMAQMEGNLAAGLKKYLSDIRHLQFADCPGRHEPGTGEIEFTRLFNLIDELEYPGFVGAEYHPLRDTESSLGWLPG